MDKENYDFIYQNIFFVYYKIMDEQNNFFKKYYNFLGGVYNNVFNGILKVWNRVIGGEENQVEHKEIFEHNQYLNIFRDNPQEKKRLENKMSGARERFDEKRDNYLEDLINLELPHMTEEGKKGTIPLIVHYSDAKRKEGGGTYEEYWNKKRKNLMNWEKKKDI